MTKKNNNTFGFFSANKISDLITVHNTLTNFLLEDDFKAFTRTFDNLRFKARNCDSAQKLAQKVHHEITGGANSRIFPAGVDVENIRISEEQFSLCRSRLSQQGITGL